MRRARPRQLAFAFRERRERRRRGFKRAIVVGTLALIVLAFTLIPTGRDLIARAAFASRSAVRGLIGATPDRPTIDAERARTRRRAIEGTRSLYRDIYGETSPAMRRLLEYAGLTPDEAVLRWGNFDKILLLPATVFAPDDSGRSYRMKPSVRSVWLRNVALPHNLAGFFLVPDRPELRPIVAGTGVTILAGSEQTTNSWGCRGPEPDPSAPLRGIVLGDSNMQGLLIGDDQTPPECLARDLARRLGRRASILNTGHLGYSTEQYAQTLHEYGDRFRPHFVLLAPCVNDFGDVGDAMRGRGDWTETKFWLEDIYQYCRTRDILCITAPVPYDHQIVASRLEGGYPGRLNDLGGASSLNWVFPIEDLVDEFARVRLQARRERRTITENPLYNVHLGDHHFTPLGAEVWARAVGRRLAPLLEWREGERR